MDKYLEPNSAYNRLWAEYQKHGSLIVACDFDDTLFDFHGTGGSYEQVKQLVRDLFDINCQIIIWTGNEDIDFVYSYLESEEIPWHLINENMKIGGKWVSGKDSRKLYANAYIDDRAGMEQVFNDLTRLVKQIRTKEFYRVAHEKTGQGLWYDNLGDFTGLIHNKFNFCKNTDLKMDFDPELVGWLSAAESLEDLYRWFSEEDIKRLQEFGWYIYKYETDDYKFYDRFQHYIIKQGNINFLEQIKL